MATALIIHAPDDALPARALAEKLRGAKLNVVLEKATGEDVREAAKGAQVIVALWSPRSVGQQSIVDDVATARAKAKVVHAQMQNAQTPAPFSGDKSVNLTGWRGEDEFAPWRELADAITERAGVAPLPPPAPRPPSGFFTPGAQQQGGAPQQAAPAPTAAPMRAAPQPAPAPRQAAPQAPPPRAAAPPPPRQAAPPPRPAPPRNEAPVGYEPDEPKKGGGMGMIIGIAALVVILGGGAAGYMWWQGQQSSHASSAALEQVDRNDPAALRAFIAANSGAAKTQAEGALTELEERSYEAASDADTIDALQGFLKDFPQSSHALAARGRIAELQANPDQPADTLTTTTGVDQPTTTDQVAPGGTTATTTTAPATGAPVQLTPPSEPSTSTEPPSAPTTP